MGSIDTSAPTSIKAYIGYDRNLPVTKTAGTLSRYRNGFDRHLTLVYDIRHQPEAFTLDTHGFQFLLQPNSNPNPNLILTPASNIDWTSPSQIKSTIYPETQSLLQSLTGATRVHCYSHLIRSTPLSAIQSLCADPSIPDTHLTNLSVPSPAVHIDHSAQGSWEVLCDNLPVSEASAVKASGKRWAIINLWRPLKTVYRDPLCVVDARTVNLERDLVPQRIYLPKSAESTFRDVSRGKSFESVGVKANLEGHRWYYCSEMTGGEGVVVKIHDSVAPVTGPGARKGDVAGGVPHTSLQIPGTEGWEARESVELRCLVFWD